MEDSKKRKRESDGPDPPEGKKPKITVGDTAAHTYVSIFNTTKVCNDNRKAIIESCKPKNQAEKDARKTSQDANGGRLSDQLTTPQHSGETSTPVIPWVNDHCGFLMNKPMKPHVLWESLKIYFTENGMMDGGDKDIRKNYPNSSRKFSESALEADYMHSAADLSACITARRCALIKYADTTPKPEPEPEAEIKTNEEAVNGGATQLNGEEHKENGCCPGQTGHHLLPSAMFDKCAAYKEGQAPTMCVEGANNSNGSHGEIHKNLKIILNDLNLDHEFGMEDAIKAALASASITFPTAACDEGCLRAQLIGYYSVKENFPCPPKKASGCNEGSSGSTSKRIKKRKRTMDDEDKVKKGKKGKKQKSIG